MSEKTEEPTAQKLRKAREEGDSGVSTNAAQAVAFLVTVSLAPAAIVALAAHSSETLRAAIERASDRTPVIADATAFAGPALLLTVPILAAAALTSAVVQLIQTGAFVASKKLTPKLDRLNFFSGFRQLFSTTRLFSVARALVAGSFVGYLAYRGLREHALDLARLPGHFGYVGLVASEVARTVCRDAALLGLALGAVDLLVVRRAWMVRLRMSKDEVKREHKESDGDPQMKAARERAHHEMLASATVGNVKNATVVIVNPTHLACALRYESEDGDEAPVLVAAGEGDLAKQIVEAARAYGVPVLRDVPLARALMELEVGAEIPEELYEAVAEILREAWEEKAKDASDR